MRQPPRGCLLGASGSLKWCAAAPSLRTRCPLPLGPSADQRRSAGRSCLHARCGGGWRLRLGPADDRGRGSRLWRCWRPRIRPAWGRSASLVACCCACASVSSTRADAPGGDTVAVWPRRAAAERAQCGCVASPCCGLVVWHARGCRVGALNRVRMRSCMSPRTMPFSLSVGRASL